MKVRSLILAVALGTAAAGAFAQSDTTPATRDNTSTMQAGDWYRAGALEQQDEARDRQLEQQGDYSQYAD
jgi:hypothetical protein